MHRVQNGYKSESPVTEFGSSERARNAATCHQTQREGGDSIHTPHVLTHVPIQARHMCMHPHTYVSLHIHIHYTYIHPYMHTSMHKYMHTCRHSHNHTHAHNHTHLIKLPNYYNFTLANKNIELTSGRLAAHRRRLWRRRQGPRRMSLDRGSRREGRECVRACRR